MTTPTETALAAARAPKPKKILAWWFCAPDADGVVRLPHGDGREVKAGETLSVEGKIVACRSGLHASVRALDALQYAPGSTICRVEVWGDVQEEPDKIAGRHRKVLWMADADKALRLFACDCAEEACRVADQPDERSLNAIRVSRLCAEGEATTGELAAARAAARAAAMTAARDAARDAAWAAAWAAARDAAWDAARAAAWDAARAAAMTAARAAARDAAWDAARAAAWDAARAAARDAQSKSLTKRLLALKPRGTK